MNVTNGRCGSVAGAQQLIFIYRDVADRRHVRFVTKKCRTCFRESYVTVHSVHSNALRDAQKSCIRMISRRNSRVFCELCSQKTPRGMLPVNSNNMITDEKKNIPQGCPQGVQNHIIHIKTANLRDQLDHFHSQT